MNRLTIALSILSVLMLALSGYIWYLHAHFKKTASSHEQTLTETIAAKEGELTTAHTRIAELEGLLSETQDLLQKTVDENRDLSDNLAEEQNRNQEFEDQINKIGSTVGTLDKLSKTDEELLQKYSKIYFLNENYMPAKLSPLDKKYLYDESIPKFIESQTEPFLADMLDDALDDGVKLWVVSAFRSFDEQKDLKGQYTVSYGSGANTFSADQGYSEHQLGTTIDLTTENLGGGLNGFETTPAYEWLQKNAYRYGFILSYPNNNAYYVFEPWHWRFVGTELAKYLHRNDKNFYDLDQREINKYLISIFD